MPLKSNAKNKPRLPRKIKILGQVWRVLYVKDLRVSSDEDDDSDDERVSGLSDGNRRTISICTTSNRTPAEVHSTLIHEILHSIIFVSGQRNLLTPAQEEALVVALEHGLAPVLSLL